MAYMPKEILVLMDCNVSSDDVLDFCS